MALSSTQVIEFAENSQVTVVTSTDDPEKLAVTTFDVSEFGEAAGMKIIPRGAWNISTDDYARGSEVYDDFILYRADKVAVGAFATVGSNPADNPAHWTLVAPLGSGSGFEEEAF